MKETYKKMTKDEMKDKISMALKDPILQQGFEIICKENAELDCQMNRNKYCYSCANVTDRCFRNEIGCPCAKYKSYKDENAELKEQIENRNCSNCRLNKTGCPNDGSCHNFSLWQPFINPKLTKAKEIIKDYLTIVKGSHTTECSVPEENRTIYVLQLNEKAEQFIKE